MPPRRAIRLFAYLRFRLVALRLEKFNQVERRDPVAASKRARAALQSPGAKVFCSSAVTLVTISFGVLSSGLSICRKAQRGFATGR